ncbi:MAG: hypothetical protein AAF797_03970 [Planctomycetota bacterium]
MAIALIFVMVLVGVMVGLWRLIASERRDTEADRPMGCGECGYAVDGLEGLTCPECGADLRVVGIKKQAVSTQRTASRFLIAIGLIGLTRVMAVVVARLQSTSVQRVPQAPMPAATPPPVVVPAPRAPGGSGGSLPQVPASQPSGRP